MNIKNGITNQINEKIIKEQYQAIEFLNKEAIKHAIIKGAALSKFCYNNLAYRGIGDVDVLIPKQEIPKLEALLKINGFSKAFDNKNDDRFSRIFMLTYSHQFTPYYKKLSNCNIVVDINFDILWGEYEGERINIEEFLEDSIEMELCGVKTRTLSPIRTLIQLILHSYKDMNSIYLIATRKKIRSDMFKDLYYLIKNNLNEISVEKLYNKCEEYKIIPYVFYVLYYTRKVISDEMLDVYVDAFHDLEGEKLLDCYGLCSKERKEWKFNFIERLEARDLFDLIKKDLTHDDYSKIAINKQVFMS